MRRRIRRKHSHRNRLSTKVIFVLGAFSIMLTLTTSWLVFMNLHHLSKIRATDNGADSGGGSAGSGEVISEFTWEKDPVVTATVGPDAIRCSKEAHASPGGRSSTNGLAPGIKGKDIDFEIEGSEQFNLDGIDISIDFRRTEESGSFFTRGSDFNFGMDNGYITIHYEIENGKNDHETIKEKTEYEIPQEPTFRTYRFLYNPASGKAEIFVNGVIVWNHQGSPNSPMHWKGAGNIMIGKNMNGGGIDRPVFDNLVIRSAGSVIPLSETLLNFILDTKDGGIRLRWSTMVNEKVDYFTIQRSVDGISFVNLANIKAYPSLETGEEYTYSDKVPVSTRIVYYRIRQTFLNGKSVIHPLSAMKLSQDKELVIERVGPVPFFQSFDLAYTLPKAGRVWLQLKDQDGKVINTETFDAPQGKNVHVYHDQQNLGKGDYTVQLSFDNKKVSTKVIKG